MEDGDLIAGARAGRNEDFEALVERYQKMIFAFVYRQLLDSDAAGDVVQATFIQAYTKLSQFRGEATFKTWLHQIALNQCRAWHRAVRARRATPIDEVPEAALAETGSGETHRDDHRTLERLVKRLPPRQRAVLSLRIFSDMPFREIARIEGISENSAKVNYHHAVMRLKRWMAGS